jgi:RHS repeat-associated protein
MVDDLGLINMNGRIYDPRLGRFLSADPNIQNVNDLQAYNRYTYVRNSPTSYNDPSGYFWSALVTLGFAAYDTYNYATGKTSGAEYAKNMALNGAALVADVATAGQGGGLAVRAANAGIRVAKAVDKANDAYQTVSTIVETGQAVANGDSSQVSRTLVTAAVERVVGGGKGKHDVDLNVKAVKAKRHDGVPEAAPTGGSNVHENAEAGKRRHQESVDELKEKHPDASVQTERTLRNADGTKAIDPMTGEGRRIDTVVVQDGKGVKSIETTSPTADKSKQSEKEDRIRENGGTYIRDKETRNLIDIKDVPTEIERRQ